LSECLLLSRLPSAKPQVQFLAGNRFRAAIDQKKLLRLIPHPLILEWELVHSGPRFDPTLLIFPKERSENLYISEFPICTVSSQSRNQVVRLIISQIRNSTWCGGKVNVMVSLVVNPGKQTYRRIRTNNCQFFHLIFKWHPAGASWRVDHDLVVGFWSSGGCFLCPSCLVLRWYSCISFVAAHGGWH